MASTSSESNSPFLPYNAAVLITTSGENDKTLSIQPLS
ncbi:hypothetical protein YPPY19_3549, partial [Yersinia pestis PY-19]